MNASTLSFGQSLRSSMFKWHLASGMIFLSASILAQPITQIDTWPGYERHLPRQVYAVGSTAYLTTSDGLQIFDLNDMDHPASLSFFPTFETWEYPTDIHVLSESNRIAIGVAVSYGSYTNRVEGIDISNPQNPELVWAGSLFHRPNQVDQYGPKVYSSHNLSGLTISTWGAAGYGSMPSTVTNATGRVAVSGSRLYVPTPSGFQIFSASSEAYLGTYNAGVTGHALTVNGLYVYLAAEDGLHIVDVLNGAAPDQIGFLPLTAEQYSPTAIQLTGNHACMVFANTNLFLMVDVSTPESPSVSGTYLFSGPVSSISVNNDQAFILAADQIYGSADLHVLDLSNPAAISRRGRLYAHGSTRHLATVSNVLFLADAGLCVLRTDTASLSVIGYLPGEWSTLAADGDRVYAGSLSGLTVYDVSTPENPTEVISLYEPATHIAVGPDFIYRIGGYGFPELVISDKSDSLNETNRLYWIQGINQLRAFDMVDDLYALFIDDFAGNLVIIDVQDPTLPVVTNYYASAPIMDVAGSVNSVGTNALLATTNGVEILALGSGPPFSVMSSWNCPAGFAPRNLCVDGERIAVASAEHLWLLDTTQFSGGDPLIADTPISHSVSHMLLNGNRLYLATGPDGVVVYEVGGEPTAPRLYISKGVSNQIKLEWETAGTGWQVQQKQDLSIVNGWSVLPGTQYTTATNLDTDLSQQFFRLMQ